MSKFTPGPWHVGEDGISIYAPGNNVAVGCAHSYKMPGKANAKIISAAPELLEALQAMLRAYGCKDAVCQDARDALAKAGL